MSNLRAVRPTFAKISNHKCTNSKSLLMFTRAASIKQIFNDKFLLPIKSKIVSTEMGVSCPLMYAYLNSSKKNTELADTSGHRRTLADINRPLWMLEISGTQGARVGGCFLKFSESTWYFFVRKINGFCGKRRG